MSKGLGRGFGALLPGDDEPVKDFSAEGVRSIAIEQIQANPHQPRKEFDSQALAELADSIREKGIIQPILVESVDGHFQIVAGERRFRAAKMVGLQEVPVIVRSFTEQDRMEIALIENIQRSDLTALEEARAYRHLMEAFSLTQEQVSQKVGKQRSTVANSLRLLKLPEEMQAALETEDFTPGHARAVLSLTNPNDQKTLFSTILQKKLSVREAELLAQTLSAGIASKSTKTITPRMPEISELEQKLIDTVGTKVQIKGNGKKGTVEIAYYSEDDFSRIFERLSGLKLD